MKWLIDRETDGYCIIKMQESLLKGFLEKRGDTIVRDLEGDHIVREGLGHFLSHFLN
jgi:hypothetical protein